MKTPDIVEVLYQKNLVLHLHLQVYSEQSAITCILAITFLNFIIIISENGIALCSITDFEYAETGLKTQNYTSLWKCIQYNLLGNFINM